MLFDLKSAFGLLTRAPVSVDMARASARGARGVWAYPIVGVAVGGLGAGVVWIGTAIGAPEGSIAAAVIASQMLATGGLHEDGLADCADGLGASNRAAMRAAMKDSRIGAYGASALCLGLLARWSALATLIAVDPALAAGAAVAAGAVSRAAVAAAMAIGRPASGDGLGATVGRAPLGSAAIAAAIATTAAVGLGPPWTILAAAVAAGAVLVAMARRLGGWTGDVLGATQQMAEIAALSTAAAYATV